MAGARRPVVTVVVLALLACLATGAVADDEATRERRHRQILEKRQDILQNLMGDLETAAEWCRTHQLPDAAEQVEQQARAILQPVSLSQLPVRVTPPVSQQQSLDEQQWRLQVQHHRQERARELYSLARSALRAGFPSLAFTLVGDVVHVDPDNKYARAVLGRQLFLDPMKTSDPDYAGEWVSGFEKKQRSGSKPQVHHPRFGWIPESNVSRYEEGLRPWKGSWISAAREAELRRDFTNAWEIPSEHFLIRTNVGLEEGVRLSMDLEIFHEWLEQNFAAFFETPAALKTRFEEASQSASSRVREPMRVHFFASRDEYDRVVQDKVPPGIETNGLYWEPDRTSYFFASEELTSRATHFHEATHQILDCATIEDRRKAARARALKLRQKPPGVWNLCENSNAWVIEGLACYMESFEITNGTISIGRPDFQRFDIARQRVLAPDGGFYLPAEQLFALGKDELQKNPNIGPLYSQSAGFMHFLMHYEDGLYRDDLIALLVALYRPDPKSVLEEPQFTKIAGVTGERLDHEYRIHMQNLEDWLNANPGDAAASGTAGGSDIDGQGRED